MLNTRQKRFSEEYIIDYNATAAAKRAGYSNKTAYSQGQRLLKNAEIREAINNALKEFHERAFITKERVLLEVAKLAFTNLSDVVRWDEEGNLTISTPEDLTPDQLASISEISKHTMSFPTKNGEEVTRTSMKIKMHNKDAALEKLMKHLSLLNDKLDITSNGEKVTAFNVTVSAPTETQPQGDQ